MMKGYRPEVEGGLETFTVEIDDVSQLLTVAPKDLFSDQPHIYMGQPVLERVLEHFHHEKGLAKRRHRLVLLMPSEKISEGLTERCRAAVERYADTAIADNKFRMADLRRNGLLQLPYALVFLIACMLLGALLSSETVPGIPSWLNTVLVEGVFIVGWVALWGPADILLFARFPLLKENRAFEALRRTAVEIRPRERD